MNYGVKRHAENIQNNVDIVIMRFYKDSTMDGSIIKNIRKLLRKNQNEFGKEVALKRSTIVAIENGYRNPTQLLFKYLSLRYPKEYKTATLNWRTHGKRRKQNH